MQANFMNGDQNINPVKVYKHHVYKLHFKILMKVVIPSKLVKYM